MSTSPQPRSIITHEDGAKVIEVHLQLVLPKDDPQSQVPVPDKMTIDGFYARAIMLAIIETSGMTSLV